MCDIAVAWRNPARAIAALILGFIRAAPRDRVHGPSPAKITATDGDVVLRRV